MNIIVYTDGSSLNNQHKGKRKGGIGVFFGDNDIRNKSIPLIESLDNKVTNQVAELTACLTALKLVCIEKLVLPKPDFDDVSFPPKKINIIICTDSQYSINSISVWAKTWKKNNWKKKDGKIIENLELIKKIHNIYIDPLYNIKFKHIKAHTNKPPMSDPSYNDWYGNMMADKLATDASHQI